MKIQLIILFFISSHCPKQISVSSTTTSTTLKTEIHASTVSNRINSSLDHHHLIITNSSSRMLHLSPTTQLIISFPCKLQEKRQRLRTLHNRNQLRSIQSSRRKSNRNLHLSWFQFRRLLENRPRWKQENLVLL